MIWVALLAEGVDRNFSASAGAWALWVALLAEGVDRNHIVAGAQDGDAASPSSRRAWIEIESQISYTGVQKVALLAEGVDRNLLS